MHIDDETLFRKTFPTARPARSLAALIAFFTCLLFAAPATLAQTATQTLPAGYESVPGNVSTNYPQNTAADQMWQWHYDSSEFNLQAPLTISDIAIRPKPGFGPGSFNFPSFKVTLIEAQTDYRFPNRRPFYGENILRSTVVRTGPWSGGPLVPLPNQTVGGFVSLGLTGSFTYDPSTGNDFIIQVEKCGTNQVWGVTADAASGAIGSVGGARYGDTASCTPSEFTSTPLNEVVPIVRIRYQPASQTLPRDYENVDGNGSVGWPFTTSSDQKWQWHYDSQQFDVQGPVAIREIYVRARSPGVNLGAFHFQGLKVTLGPATTDYVSHDPEFAANIEGQKIVREGPWSGGPVGPSGGATATWVPLGLAESFVYDPSSGKDFIVQLETCGSAQTWTTTMDGRLAGVGNGGGNRYGHSGSCTALTQTHGSSTSDFVPIIRVDFEPLSRCEGSVATFPYRQDFDQGLAAGTDMPQGWLNVAGEALDAPGDWMLRSGPTPSVNTGPSGDHTTGNGLYAYVEDSLSDNPAVCLLSPCFDLTGLTNPHMSYWVHSRSVGGPSWLHIGVFRMPNGPFIQNLGPPIGHLGPNWVEQTLDLTSFAGDQVRIQFRVNNDNGSFNHDIAIDDFRLYEPTVQGGQPAQFGATLDTPGALDPNGLPVTPGLPGPYFKTQYFGEPLPLEISGLPNQPLILFTGPLLVGQAALPGIGQIDVGGPGTIFILDGLSGMGLLPGFFSTNLAGTFTFGAPADLPPGLSIALQAGLLTGPATAALSNALVVETL